MPTKLTVAQAAVLRLVRGDKLKWDWGVWEARGSRVDFECARDLVRGELVQPIEGRTNEWHISAAGLDALAEYDNQGDDHEN